MAVIMKLIVYMNDNNELKEEKKLLKNDLKKKNRYNE